MPVRVRNLSTGCLFVPVKAGDEHFLAGRINETPVLMTLDGEEPFRVAETGEWRAVRNGLAVQNIRFEVDLESGFIAFDEADTPPGTLVRSAGAIGIIGFDRHQPYTVWVSGGEKRGVSQEDVAFTKWQIVVGPEDSIKSLFAHEGTERAAQT
jgi:hypothetical protein